MEYFEYFTYTAEYTNLPCPFCGATVPIDTDDPTEPWIGHCKNGHAALYKLDDKDDNL